MTANTDVTANTDEPSATDVTSGTDEASGTGTRTARGAARGVVVAFPGVRPPVAERATGGGLTIDCADCAHQDSDICSDCVVSFIVGREPEDAVVVDAAEARAVRLLERAGLVPGVRHEARASGE